MQSTLAQTKKEDESMQKATFLQKMVPPIAPFDLQWESKTPKGDESVQKAVILQKMASLRIL